MKEKNHIKAQNCERIAIALEVIRRVIAGDDYGVPPKSLRDVRLQLDALWANSVNDLEGRGLVVDCWEVYERDRETCVAFKTKELAEAQDVFDEHDRVSKARVRMTVEQRGLLSEKKPVFL